MTDEALVQDARRALRAGATLRGARVPVVRLEAASPAARACQEACRRRDTDMVELRRTREDRADGVRVFTWKALAWRLGLETIYRPRPVAR